MIGNWIILVRSSFKTIKRLAMKCLNEMQEKLWKKRKLYFKPRVITNKVQTLYVNVNGLLIIKWKDKKYEVKFALPFTSAKGNPNRVKLENKLLIPFEKDMKTKDIAQFLFWYL